MTADSGTATVERADRARGVADVCAPHWCHWIAVTFQGPVLGQSSSTAASWRPNQMRSKKTKNKKKNNVCVRIRPHTCVGEWHEIRIIPHSVPVAKQTGCNVCEMTFALPEEFGISLSCGFAFRAEARARESKSLNRERKGKE